MYNRGFVAQNILRASSQSIGLKLKYKIFYVNAASKYSVYKLMSYVPASLLLQREFLLVSFILFGHMVLLVLQ